MKSKDIYQLLKQYGWTFYRRAKGRHEIYKHPKTGKTLLFSPRGGRDLTHHSQRALLNEIQRGAAA
jgi:predicted RNA binding protein YcfA (HicA-like mRNA interferase family)